MPKSPAPKRPKVAHSAPPAAPQLAQEALVAYGPALPPAPAVADLQRVMRVQGGLATRALERLEGSTALADDDMARVLGISRHTVGDHVKHLYRKLNISSRAEAALEARERGLG